MVFETRSHSGLFTDTPRQRPLFGSSDAAADCAPCRKAPAQTNRHAPIQQVAIALGYRSKP